MPGPDGGSPGLNIDPHLAGSLFTIQSMLTLTSNVQFFSLNGAITDAQPATDCMKLHCRRVYENYLQPMVAGHFPARLSLANVQDTTVWENLQ